MKNVLSRLKKRNILKAGAVATAVMFIFSCAGIPERAEMDSSVRLLPAGADVIIKADIQGNTELIQPVLNAFAGNIPENMADEFIARTETVWAGLELSSDADVSVFKSSIVAEGDYPKGLIDWGLCWDAGWESVKIKPHPDSGAEMSYWNAKKGTDQLAVPDKNYLMASSGRMDEMLRAWAGGAVSADGSYSVEAEQSADITIQTRGLSPEEYALFIPELKKVPIDSLLLMLDREDDYYILSGEFRMDGPANALLFTTIFRTLAIAAKDRNGNRLFPRLKEIRIDREGSNVVLGGMKIPADYAAAIELKWLELGGIR